MPVIWTRAPPAPQYAAALVWPAPPGAPMIAVRKWPRAKMAKPNEPAHVHLSFPAMTLATPPRARGSNGAPTLSARRDDRLPVPLGNQNCSTFYLIVTNPLATSLPRLSLQDGEDFLTARPWHCCCRLISAARNPAQDLSTTGGNIKSGSALPGQAAASRTKKRSTDMNARKIQLLTSTTLSGQDWPDSVLTLPFVQITLAREGEGDKILTLSPIGLRDYFTCLTMEHARDQPIASRPSRRLPACCGSN